MLLNHGLPIIASGAALDIECYLQGGEQSSSEYVNHLAEEVDRISKNPSIDNSVMLTKLAWPNREDLKGKSIEEAYVWANLLAKDLKYFREFPREKQEELRDACMELSDLFYEDMYHTRYGLVA